MTAEEKVFKYKNHILHGLQPHGEKHVGLRLMRYSCPVLPVTYLQEVDGWVGVL